MITSTWDSEYVFKEGLVILLGKQQGIIAMRQLSDSPEVSIQNIKLLYEHKKDVEPTIVRSTF